MKRLCFLCLLLGCASSAQAATITVCASGCTYPNTQLQPALYAAAPGDTVLLESGFNYASGGDGYILGSQCHGSPRRDCIIVRTGVTSSGVVMALSLFPPTGIRVDPTKADCPHGNCRGVFASFIPSQNNEAAIRTIYPGEIGPTCAVKPCVADGWTLQFIEGYERVQYPDRPLIRFGTNKEGKEWNLSCSWPDPTPSCWNVTLPGGEWQDTLDEVPRYLSLIQSDLHGDPIVGQYGGLLVASKDTYIVGNSFRDFKSTSEVQAITGLNGIGPVLVENNHIEATTENMMFGGSDTKLQLRAAITGSPTTTNFTMSTPVWFHPDTSTTTANFTTDIYNNIFVAITHAGTLYSGFSCALSGVTSTTATCTTSKTLPFTPSAGDVVQWCWLFGGLTVRYNHFYKPAAWMNPIMPTPTAGGFTVVGSTASGTLSSGTYCYQIISYAFVSSATWARSAPTAEKCATIASAGHITITWAAVAAQGYIVHGRATGTKTMYWDVGGATTYTDSTNTAGTSGGIIAENYWLVKNNFELKHCDGGAPMGACLIEYNVIDNSWCCTQQNIVTIKVHNQDGNDISSTERNLTFRNNWIRHASSALALVSSDAVSQPSGIMTDVTVSNNLFTDMSRSWIFPYESAGNLVGNNIIMAGSRNAGMVGSTSGIRITIAHNTFIRENTDMHAVIFFGLNFAKDVYTDLVVRDNIMARESVDASQIAANYYGVTNEIDSARQVNGTTSWTSATTGASSAHHNMWPESNSTRNSFDTNGFYGTQATLQGYFVNYAGCLADTITSCALSGASPLDSTASDSTDVGADVAAIKVGTDIALSGDNSGAVIPPPPPTHGQGLRVRIRIRGGGAQ